MTQGFVRSWRQMIRGMVVLFGIGARSIAQQPASSPSVAVEGRSAERNARAQDVLARRVTVRVDGMSLHAAVEALAASAHVRILYRTEAVDAVKAPVSLHAAQMSLGTALSHLLVGTGLQMVPVTGNAITIQPVMNEPVVQGSVNGHVMDAKTRQPLAGVTVLLDDATRGVLTDSQGMFYMAGVVPGSHRVTARLLGRGRQVKTVTVVDGESTTVELALETQVQALDQVVVTGTVIPTELKAVPNAITVITAKQIEERGITHIDQLFRGDVPGLFAQNQGSGALLDAVIMFSRGTTALSTSSAGTGLGTNPIKTYVDGVEMANPAFLSQIDPKSIERIEILTGPQASTIYGSNAINGVMQIFTKRGTSNTPQLTLNLLSGWVQNNFSNALTPQHDYSAQVNGIEGRLSYNAGGSWNYMGAWTPAKQSTRAGGFGGARLDLPTSLGRMTADMTFRRTVTQNQQRGNIQQIQTGYGEMGWYMNVSSNGLSQPTTAVLTGQTLGLTLSYVPTSWWSHDLEMGQDVSDQEQRITARGYMSVDDTSLYLSQNHTDRRSFRYTTTMRIPISSFAQATVTAGADAWQNLTFNMAIAPQTLTGSLTGSTSVSRQPGHNAGGFLQSQFGIKDRLFFTYGLRAEWNPNFGAEAQPNYAPRYGIAYTQDIAAVTVKVRESYGRSTRPPAPTLKVAQNADYGPTLNTQILPLYGNFNIRLANPELGPEHQQGGEGGLELYFGTRSSLVITRYNQTVNGLIAYPIVDSVRSLVPTTLANSVGADGYGYIRQYQYLNIGSIRNQGWELQGSANTGPLTTKGTYSWTKSRTIGITPKYRTFFTPSNYPQYQPGATFQLLPEHTWALEVTYAKSTSNIGINVTGTGWAPNAFDDFFFKNLNSKIRLPQNRLAMNPRYTSFNPGYAIAGLNASHQFSSRAEGVLQVQNLADHYTNDLNAGYAVLGRQLKAGLRLRVQ